MNVNVNIQPCQCELCLPNLFLGRDVPLLLPIKPRELKPRETSAKLAEIHARKVVDLDKGDEPVLTAR